MTKTFKQSPKTKNSKGGKLIRIVFYGKIQCECVEIYIKLFLKIVNKRLKNTKFYPPTLYITQEAYKGEIQFPHLPNQIRGRIRPIFIRGRILDI